MRTVRTIAEVRAALAGAEGVGLVPTKSARWPAWSAPIVGTRPTPSAPASAARTSAIVPSGTQSSTSSAPSSASATPRSRKRAERARPTRPAPMTRTVVNMGSSSVADTGQRGV